MRQALEEKNAYRSLVGTLERPWHRWKDYIKTSFKEMACGVWTGFIWLMIRNIGGAQLKQI